MERILKSFCILMVVLFVAITVGSVAWNDLYAGGGVNYKVTVKNDTEYDARVGIYVEKLAYAEMLPEKDIPSGGTQTFETGAWCPSGLAGIIFKETDQGTRNLYIWRGMVYETAYTAACWNSSWRIEKRGVYYKFIKD